MPRPGDHTLLAAARHLADTHGPTPGWDRTTPCAEADPAAFFPTHGGNVDGTARRTCARCPVQIDCVADGIRTVRDGLSPGIRAGLTEQAVRDAADTASSTRARRRAERARAARAVTTGTATVPDLAAAHGVSERTLQRWVAEHRDQVA